jgi:exosortase
MPSNQTARVSAAADQVTPWYIIGGLCAVMLWAYWNTIEGLLGAWTSAQYSHGFLVPLFAAVLIAMRREPFQPVPNSARWAGIGIIAAALALRMFAAQYHIVTFDIVSIIPLLAGIFVVAGGWPSLRWAAAPLAFLLFMIPLPTKVERALFIPLQSVATKTSTYTLQTIGVPDTFNEGNSILIGDGIHLNVEEQCSGLRMGTIFLAMAVALTMITDGSWWEKAFIILSAIPIAVGVNVTRIVITAILYMMLGPESEIARHFFHDLAGWFMMPLALGLLYAEMQLLSHIFITEERVAPRTAGFGTAPTIRRPAATRAQ